MSESEKKSAAVPQLFDEWLFAKKIGVKPRWVVRWRREHGEDGKDFARECGADEAGRAWERIGLTAAGAAKASKALGFRAKSPAGCELVRRGVQVEVKQVPSNVRLLICERVAAARVEINGGRTGPLENVTVRDNADYRAGDEFVAERDGSVLIKTGGVLAQGEW